MKPCILKFGGASVLSSDSFRSIAQLIVGKMNANPRLVVVVSAMGDTTNQLFELAKSVNPNPPKREQDMLVSVGERISISLLAMALASLGVEAVSFTGSQSGIITTDDHSDAKIVDVRPKRILSALDRGQIAIVAGFQGVSLSGEITTLGRGGSDTTAVALGAALGSQAVEFYKDVGAIFESDPKNDPLAKRLERLSYGQAVSMAKSGARVLHARSIALAEKNGIRLEVYPIQAAGQPGSVVGFGAARKPEIVYEEGC